MLLCPLFRVVMCTMEKLMEQPMFTEHAMMKGIAARVSEQRYKDANGFIDDFTR